MPTTLVEELDNTIRNRYGTRSEAIREATRNLIDKIKIEKRENKE